MPWHAPFRWASLILITVKLLLLTTSSSLLPRVVSRQQSLRVPNKIYGVAEPFLLRKRMWVSEIMDYIAKYPLILPLLPQREWARD